MEAEEARGAEDAAAAEAPAASSSTTITMVAVVVGVSRRLSGAGHSENFAPQVI